jgi:hypothetical protein
LIAQTINQMSAELNAIETYLLASNTGVFHIADFTTSGSGSDVISVPGMTATGVCNWPLTPTNTKAANIAFLTSTVSGIGTITINYPAGIVGATFSLLSSLQ